MGSYSSFASGLVRHSLRNKHLISMIFAHYEGEIEMHESEFDIVSGNFDGTYTEVCQAFVEASGGIAEFDYEP